jgi:hypothetical protein
MTTIRVAAHVHSEWSYDAEWTLPALAAAFARRGYDAVLMAEHDRTFDDQRWAEYRTACADASDERILLVPGLEYEDANSVVHVPVWGRDLPFLGRGRPTAETLSDVARHGGTAVFAHPWRRDALGMFDPAWTPLLAGVEIWNRHYDGVAPNPAAARLAEEQGLSPFVALDFHSRRQFFPLAMRLEVEGGPSVDAVYEALAARRFRPAALRVSALRFTRGVPAKTMRGLERSRRALRGPVRRLERKIRS